MADQKTDEPKKEETAMVKVDEAYYQANRNLGMEKMDQDDVLTPTISIVQKSSKVTDSNAMPFKPGTIYYKAENAVYDTLDVVFLAFTKKDLPSYEDKSILNKNYIFLGVIIPEMKPFKWFLSKGGAIYKAKEFLTSVRFMKKPMFAVKVKLSTEKKSNEKGEWFSPKIDIAGLVNQEETLQLENLVRMYGPALEDEKDGSHSEDVDPSDIPF